MRNDHDGDVLPLADVTKERGDRSLRREVQAVERLVEQQQCGAVGQRLGDQQPLLLTETAEKFDIVATVEGGGSAGQAGAIRHGISRALCVFDAEKRTAFKRAGFLTRDARKKERKKYGRPGARKRFQYSKR